ncbi:MAG: glutamate racemase [Longimicrobiales bacterium]
MNPSDRPIGVFDSGIGGLTVVRELRHRLPDESIVYFGDTARVPYGAKSPETVERYSQEAGAFLLSRDVKLVVIACNTATAHAFDVLSSTLPVPVIGVIEPGARAAVEASRTGRIGVIGTVGTIRSGAYDLAVRRRLHSARVYAQPCPLFVPLVEEGLCDGDAARIIARDYLDPLREMDVDVLILGCTHYPLLRPLLQDIMGSAVELVDSAHQTARDVAARLDELGTRTTGAVPPTCTFVASDSPLRFRDVGRSFVGELIETVEHVDVEAWMSSTKAVAGR